MANFYNLRKEKISISFTGFSKLKWYVSDPTTEGTRNGRLRFLRKKGDF